MTEKIAVFIEPLETGGFLVDSDDLPQLNIFVHEEGNLVTAVSQAIKYLYRHNRNMEVNVMMPVPDFGKPVQDVPRLETRRKVSLELAA